MQGAKTTRQPTHPHAHTHAHTHARTHTHTHTHQPPNNPQPLQHKQQTTHTSLKRVRTSVGSAPWIARASACRRIRCLVALTTSVVVVGRSRTHCGVEVSPCRLEASDQSDPTRSVIGGVEAVVGVAHTVAHQRPRSDPWRSLDKECGHMGESTMTAPSFGRGLPSLFATSQLQPFTARGAYMTYVNARVTREIECNVL